MLIRTPVGERGSSTPTAVGLPPSPSHRFTWRGGFSSPPGLFSRFSDVSQFAFASVSSTRSCGRFGPAMLGTTVDKSKLQRLAEQSGSGVSRRVEHPLRLHVLLHQLHLVFRTPAHPQVAQSLGVHREDAAGRAILRRHVGDSRAVGEGEGAQAQARRTRRTCRPRPWPAASA